MTTYRRASIAALILGLAACDEPGGKAASQLDGADTAGTIDTGATSDDADTDATGDADTNTTGDADTTGDTDTNTPDVPLGPAPIVDPSCVDGRYTEAIATELAPIADLVSTFSEADYLSFVDDVLERRYPLGAHLVREANRLGLSTFGNCIERFTRQRSAAPTLMRELSTVVHECGHILDIRSGGFSSSVYVITEDLTFTCNRGDTTTRGGDTFARSLLNADDYASLLPDDFYRDVYLDGDPNDGVFEGGDQGFNSVLEEATQYVNSLATDYYFRDQLGGFSISAKDGILTFLWYIQRYLRIARLEFPTAYNRLTTDPCWREAILTVWGRAWLYLEASRSHRQLGINAATLEALVLDPNLLEEIGLVRAAHGCL